MKVALVCSSGGHLAHLLWIRSAWDDCERVWVCFDTVEARARLKDEHVAWAHHPTNRNISNLLRNGVVAWRFFCAQRPDVVVTSGAGVAIPWVLFGRLFGVPCVYLEVVDRIERPSLTLRLLEPLLSLVMVHDAQQMTFSSKAVSIGSRT